MKLTASMAARMAACVLLLPSLALAWAPDFVVHAEGSSSTQDGARMTAMHNAGLQCIQAGSGVKDIWLTGQWQDGSGIHWASATAVCGGAPNTGEMPGPLP